MAQTNIKKFVNSTFIILFTSLFLSFFDNIFGKIHYIFSANVVTCLFIILYIHIIYILPQSNFKKVYNIIFFLLYIVFIHFTLIGIFD